MLKLFLWFRYLSKRRIVFLSIAAVALSVALLIVVASLFTGFIDAYEQSAVDMLGDFLLMSSAAFPQYEKLIEQLEQTDVVAAATAVMIRPGLLHLGKGKVRGVQIFGVEPDRVAQVVKLRDACLIHQGPSLKQAFMMEDDPQRTAGLIGIGVAQEPNQLTDQYDREAIEQQFVGKPVMLISGTVENRVSPSGSSRPVPKRRNIPFTITDLVFTGNYLFDSESVYLPLKTLCKELYPGQAEVKVERIQIKLAPGADPESARAQILGVWRAFTQEQGLRIYAGVDSAVGMQAPYMSEIRKQMGVLMLIFGIVDCGVILLVFCIFYMIVKLKQKDIGIIKSCGGSSWTCTSIFLGFGVYVGVLGSVLGVLLGYVFTKNINAIERQVGRMLGLNLWDSSVYMFEQIPNQMHWGSVLNIVALALAAAALGALVPALVAAKTRPVEILRYE